MSTVRGAVMMFSVAAFAAAAGLAVIAAIAGAAVRQVGAAAEESATDAAAGAHRLTVEVPGTALSVELALVPGARGADGETEAPALWFGVMEVTWDLYDVYLYGLDEPDREAEEAGVDAIGRPSKPYLPPDRGFGHKGYAAISMSHHAATEFCKWLSAKTGRAFRLPTEAEWERACRGGAAEGAAYCFGDDAALLGEYAWFKANAEAKAHECGTKKENGYGLFDVHGNVREWVTTAEGKPTTKGGSFVDEAEVLRVEAAVRPSYKWNESDPQIPKSVWWLADAPFVGFRVVCELSPEEAKKYAEEAEGAEDAEGNGE